MKIKGGGDVWHSLPPQWAQTEGISEKFSGTEMFFPNTASTRVIADG